MQPSRTLAAAVVARLNLWPPVVLYPLDDLLGSKEKVTDGAKGVLSSNTSAGKMNYEQLWQYLL